MKLQDDTIIHVGVNGSDHLFHLIADGGRPVLEIYVDENDPTYVIRINAVGASLDNIQSTKGHTHTDLQYTEDVNGIPDGVKPFICIACIGTYVIGRIPTLMARVYLPKVNV